MKVAELMTKDPIVVTPSTTVLEASRAMRDKDIGDVVVCEDNQRIRGVVTDRDIVVRTIAEAADPASTRVDAMLTEPAITIEADADVASAVDLMGKEKIRRLPVTESGAVVGIVSIGDLAEARDRQSALGEISAAPPNN